MPHGIVLVTGPTGSGKTTTLYAALNAIKDPTIKIITVEDPVEYHTTGISQIQVHSKIGLTFAAGLRSILRHDPDVILIGEIRDGETAQSAIQASLTGHLVFSTLHTNDASGAFTRLVDMGVEPYLVASTIEGVLAQRLLRRLCPKCKEAYDPKADEFRNDFPEPFRRSSCVRSAAAPAAIRGIPAGPAFTSCWSPTRRFAACASTAPARAEILDYARQNGMKTLRQSGFEQSRDGHHEHGRMLRITKGVTI